jgi:triosephosphate isomerase
LGQIHALVNLITMVSLSRVLPLLPLLVSYAAALLTVTPIGLLRLSDLAVRAIPRHAEMEDSRYDDSRTLSFSRRPIMAGNWKLNPETFDKATNLLKLLHANFVNHRDDDGSDNVPEVVVFPPFPFLSEALNLLEGSGIKVGAQNVGLFTNGAYTGEVSASMVQSMGVDYVMLGHSERRMIFEETDADINAKVHLCLAQAGLHIILCVGETDEEYESELLSSVTDCQIKKGLRGVTTADLERIVIAYEPVWAIGTGKVATPEQAQIAHVTVRKSLSEMYGHEVAHQMRIQYGGSVKADNVDDIMAMPDVDGALVGGASLDADSFTRIVDGGTRSQTLSSSRGPKELTARLCVPTKNVLGESPVWSVKDQALYWISAPEEEVWTWNLKDPAYRRLVGTTLGCVALKESKTSGSLVLAGERAFLEINMSPNTRDFASGPTILCERPEQCDVTRPNDGRVDRAGRLVFGMYNNFHRSPVNDANIAGIYRLGENGELESLLDDSLKYRVSNCICFPESGDVMFFCDTPTRKIYAFDYPQEKGGKLSNRRLVWTMPSNLPGGPDGAQVDAQGFIWAAISGAGRVVRIDPSSGTVNMVVHLPVKCPTSVTFGGKDLDEIFITTRGPDGGGIYRVKAPFGIRGLPEPEYKA